MDYKIIENYSDRFIRLQNMNDENDIIAMSYYDLGLFNLNNHIVNYDTFDDVEYIDNCNFVTLYHVSFDTDDKNTNKVFIPGIPKSSPMFEGLDFYGKGLNRICLSNAVENCITAIKDGIDMIYSGIKFMLYTIDIPDNDKCLYNYDYVYNYCNVTDANFTKEYWFTQKLFIHGELCEIVDYNNEEYYSIVTEYDREQFYRELSYRNYSKEFINSIDNYENFFNFINFEIYNNEKYDDLAYNDLSDILNCMNIGYNNYISDLIYAVIE